MMGAYAVFHFHGLHHQQRVASTDLVTRSHTDADNAAVHGGVVRLVILSASPMQTAVTTMDLRVLALKEDIQTLRLILQRIVALMAITRERGFSAIEAQRAQALLIFDAVWVAAVCRRKLYAFLLSFVFQLADACVRARNTEALQLLPRGVLIGRLAGSQAMQRR